MSKPTKTAKIKRLIARGYNTKEIAVKLDVTTQYVYSVRSKLRKLGELPTPASAPTPPAGLASLNPKPVPTSSDAQKVAPEVHVPTWSRNHTTAAPSTRFYGIESSPPPAGVFELVLYKLKQWFAR
jgi:hypothetical protein